LLPTKRSRTVRGLNLGLFHPPVRCHLSAQQRLTTGKGPPMGGAADHHPVTIQQT
jgi:hypothetical protein